MNSPDSSVELGWSIVVYWKATACDCPSSLRISLNSVTLMMEQHHTSSPMTGFGDFDLYCERDIPRSMNDVVVGARREEDRQSVIRTTPRSAFSVPSLISFVIFIYLSQPLVGIEDTYLATF